MLAVINSKFLNVNFPVFINWRAGEVLLYLGISFLSYGYPYPLGTHGYHIMVNNSLTDQIVYINPVGGDQRHKIFINIELNNNLEFLQYTSFNQL